MPRELGDDSCSRVLGPQLDASSSVERCGAIDLPSHGTAVGRGSRIYAGRWRSRFDRGDLVRDWLEVPRRIP